MESYPKRRSRSGCTECRSRHRKCDEARPSCSSCRRSGKECTYEVRLSWGGRPFHKSRFGDCLRRDPGLVQVPVTSPSVTRQAFVYGSSISQPNQQSPADDGSQSGSWEETGVTLTNTSQTLSMFESSFNSTNNRIIKNPDTLQWLHPDYRSLLDHFTSSTTRSLSCHKAAQRDFCSVLLPMALQTPHLLVAILSLAATHRVSLGLEQNQIQLDLLKAASLSQLKDVLAQPEPALNDATVATTLTLCMTDVVSHGRSPDSWRIHLQGAAAMISEHLQSVIASPNSLTFATSLLWRWFFSIETVSLLCGNLAVSPVSRTGIQIQRIFGIDGIDDLAGFSSSLVPVFNDINILAIQSEAEIYQNQSAITSQTAQPNNLLIERCHRAIREVSEKLASVRKPRFRPGVDGLLSSVHLTDFAALDETYHHVALLQLYRRVLNLPSSSPLVQTSVDQIISRVSSMHFLEEACPGVAVLQPLFSAGCEAHRPTDRDKISGLLCRMESRYGMGNVRSARGFLEELWAMRDASGDLEGRVRWDKVMGLCSYYSGFGVYA
ncbi:hypothetical protein FQN52_001807 [Onygenales sp. PD_12]|nr:hypothetical protein FQN52_001807 [Onygenales sp. PD_12]